MRPPRNLRKTEKELWLARKAMLGFRESGRLYQDSQSSEFEGEGFEQLSKGESNLSGGGASYIAEHFRLMIEPLTAMNNVFKTMHQKMGHLMYYTKLGTIEAAAQKIVTINGLFSGQDYRTSEAISVFKNGQLTVKHEFPAMIQARVHVEVKIDSEKLAEDLASVTFANNLQLGTVGATTAPYAPAVGGYGMGGGY